MYTIELHAEVAVWLSGLNRTHFNRVDSLVGRLAQDPRGAGLSTRHVRGSVWELRFRLSGDAWRVTYWVAPQEKRLVLLTVIRKTQDVQQADLERAIREQEACARWHGPATEEFRR